MGGRLCYAVYPGDAATALIPFDAKARLATPSGIKELSIEQLAPGDMMVDGRIQSHVVRFNEILVEVVIPPPKPGLRASFEKLRPRGVWDFAMASLALTLQVRDRLIEDARVVFGGCGKARARTGRRGFLARQVARGGLGRSGRSPYSRQRRATQIQLQRHENRNGKGASGVGSRTTGLNGRDTGAIHARSRLAARSQAHAPISCSSIRFPAGSLR